ncbi:MAG: hypothetical protein GY749_15365, partial [Desulfobacteraceae bacterium]|nr:hypothetical protein [Desulfobacteraceae bacterium]
TLCVGMQKGRSASRRTEEPVLIREQTGRRVRGGSMTKGGGGELFIVRSRGGLTAIRVSKTSA